MKKENLNKTAQSFFDNNDKLAAIYGTEKGHFFYTKEARQQFLNKGGGTDKPVDFIRPEQEPIEDVVIPEDMPGYEALIEHGLKTIADVENVNNLVKEVTGVGEATAKAINEYIKSMD